MKTTEVHQEEHHLWERLKDGDTDAFGKISTQYYRLLFDYGRKFTKDRELIKDVIQDVFLLIWQKRAHIDTDENVKVYLLKIVRNRLFKELQKQQLRASEDYFDYLEITDSEETLIISQESTQNIISKLNLHVKNLPKRQQEVLFLKFYDNLSNEEIAEIMNINRQSVANLLYNGLRLLKTRLFFSIIGFLLMLLLF
ncbi:RNA polymerase sigma factor [Runella zeae]|jgi:RNA polymerase sigma factor (sigma-70 family)|uniref:RNA polymerase sigma factor n=1 Tax=Runella zeae TaxID=94255 RepID=UPI0004028C34|nr:sigma-70 family RNA polymerase sigma factor [Runella zeae]